MALSLECLSPVLPSKNRSCTSLSASSTIPPSASTASAASSLERLSDASGARNAVAETRTRSRGGAAAGSDSTCACVPDGGGRSVSLLFADDMGVPRTMVGRLAVEPDAVDDPLRSAPPPSALGGDAARAGVPGAELAREAVPEDDSERPPTWTIMSSRSSHSSSSKRSRGESDESASSFARKDASIESL